MREFELKKSNLEKEVDNRLIKEKRKLHKHFQEEILALRTRLNLQMHESLTNESKKLHNEHESRKKAELERISEIKKKLNSERGTLARLKLKLSSELKRIKNEETEYKKEIETNLEKEKQDAIKKSVSINSRRIKKELKKEFDNRLKLELKSKQAEFEKKKADLALELQKKAKTLFN
jgi:hypothetical protein